jgi:diaminohydroxyphosphoribosylaminopyrimidine deaminase/5-amino-6-(5-phosphoribosylamino)uracil reductase
VFTIADHRHMTHALRLAARGLYTTAPNPRVGCVLVSGSRIIGEGFHQRAGEPHAEVIALNNAGAQAHGATAYVTLEPCRHTGRTPPCTGALLKAGVARVVAAMPDPNPAVEDQGLAQLAAAGIVTQCGLLSDQARALNAGFIARMTRARPFVRVKLASSLDAHTAMASGESQWVTGPQARRDVQHWRAQSGAVITGIGTILADDPSLNVRAQDIPPHYSALLPTNTQAGHDSLQGPVDDSIRQPLRVILDSQLRTPDTARTLQLKGDVIIAGLRKPGPEHRQLQSQAELLVLPADAEKPDLHALLALLAQREVNDVLVEAGAELAGAFVHQGLVDELLIYMAPTLLGSQARGLLQLPGITRMSQQLRLQFIDQCSVGNDIRIRARLAPD